MAQREALEGTLILGGGFVGAYVARLVGKRGATIIGPENFMLYTPILPEAAAGTLEPRHVVVPLRQMCRHAELLLGQATTADLEQRTVTYHLYQLPLLSRKLRVVVDWTVALFFRPDIAELGMLGHPKGLCDS